jgi:hypothetical protein
MFPNLVRCFTLAKYWEQNSDQHQMSNRCWTHMACATKRVVKYSLRPKRELMHNVVLAYVLTLSDLEAIRFKYHDWIKQCLFSFQSVIPGARKATSISTHSDNMWSFAQTKSSILDWRKGLTPDRMHGQRANAYVMDLWLVLRVGVLMDVKHNWMWGTRGFR